MSRSCRRLALALLLAAAAVSRGTAGEGDFFTHLHTEKAMANVTVSPARKGPVEIAIQLETTEEKPLVAKAVSVTLSGSKVKLNAVEAERRGEDKWSVKARLPTAGRWTLRLDISIPDAGVISIEAPIVIK